MTSSLLNESLNGSKAKVFLKRRLSCRQNLCVIWFLAKGGHVGCVSDSPKAVHHKGCPAQNTYFFDETAIFNTKINTHVIRKNDHLIHTGRAAPAFLGIR